MDFSHYISKLEKLMYDYCMKSEEYDHYSSYLSQIKYRNDRQEIYDLVMNKFNIDISSVKTKSDLFVVKRKAKLMKIR